MNGAGLNLAGIGMIAAGGVLAYSGVNDPVGGPIGVLRDLLTGKTPTPGVRVVTPGTAVGSAVGAAIGGAASGINAGTGARIVDVARGYLGVRYSLGGASNSGMDCSGLVMVAYRDGAGIVLPHKATLQAARGRLVSRDQVQAGDLVAWGVPGNYPHIALAVNTSTCIAAWTWGVPVKYGPIDQKAVPGFGLPDILRVLG
jgi:cell wall-associated NlpC family hydrolase